MKVAVALCLLLAVGLSNAQGNGTKPAETPYYEATNVAAIPGFPAEKQKLIGRSCW